LQTLLDITARKTYIHFVPLRNWQSIVESEPLSSGGSKARPAGTFHTARGYSYILYCIRTAKAHFSVEATEASSCLRHFPIVLWCAESEYEHENRCTRLVLLQALGEILGLCYTLQ